MRCSIDKRSKIRGFPRFFLVGVFRFLLTALLCWGSPSDSWSCVPALSCSLSSSLAISNSPLNVSNASAMAFTVLVDVADSVRLRLSRPSRITVNMSCISCDTAGTREAPFMAALSVTHFSMFSDKERMFSAWSSFLFLPGFSLVPFCSCVLISVLFSFRLEKQIIATQKNLSLRFQRRQYTEFAQAQCYLT